MGREYDDGVPIRRHTRRRSVAAPVAGVLISVAAGAGLIWFAIWWSNRPAARPTAGDFYTDTPPPLILDADSWTTRDIVSHANKGLTGGGYKMVTMHGSTFITDADDDTIHTRTYTDRSAVDSDDGFVSVVRFDTKDKARMFAGDHPPERVWCWNRFVFSAKNADAGVSGRLRRLLGGG